jgi:hypothetical protein
MGKRFAYLLLSTLSASVASADSSAQEPKKEAAVSFKQYLGVYTKRSPQQQIVLQRARVQHLGGRAFLVGTPVAVEDNARRLSPRTGMVWWIALRDVTEFYEFDDLRGYRFDGKPPRFTGE